MDTCRKWHDRGLYKFPEQYAELLKMVSEHGRMPHITTTRNPDGGIIFEFELVTEFPPAYGMVTFDLGDGFYVHWEGWKGFLKYAKKTNGFGNDHEQLQKLARGEISEWMPMEADAKAWLQRAVAQDKRFGDGGGNMALANESIITSMKKVLEERKPLTQEDLRDYSMHVEEEDITIIDTQDPLSVHDEEAVKTPNGVSYEGIRDVIEDNLESAREWRQGREEEEEEENEYQRKQLPPLNIP